MPECENYGGGSIAAAVIGTFFATLILVVIIIFLRSWQKRRKAKSSPLSGLVLVEEGDEGPGGVGGGGGGKRFTYDNPSFVDDTNETNENGQHQHGSVQQNGKGKTVANQDESGNKKAPWGPFSFLFNRNSRNALDDSVLEEPQRYTVALKGHDFTGLGFSVCGNMRDGIYIKDMMQRGPAAETKQIIPGDRITGMTVSFKQMVLEDALTLLSYASPYEVTLEMMRLSEKSLPHKGIILSSPTGAHSSGPGGQTSTIHNSERVCHPFFKSQSIDDLRKVGKEHLDLKVDRVKRQGNGLKVSLDMPKSAHGVPNNENRSPKLGVTIGMKGKNFPEAHQLKKDVSVVVDEVDSYRAPNVQQIKVSAVKPEIVPRVKSKAAHAKSANVSMTASSPNVVEAISPVLQMVYGKGDGEEARKMKDNAVIEIEPVEMKIPKPTVKIACQDVPPNVLEHMSGVSSKAPHVQIKIPPVVYEESITTIVEYENETSDHKKTTSPKKEKKTNKVKAEKTDSPPTKEKEEKGEQDKDKSKYKFGIRVLPDISLGFGKRASTPDSEGEKQTDKKEKSKKKDKEDSKKKQIKEEEVVSIKMNPDIGANADSSDFNVKMTLPQIEKPKPIIIDETMEVNIMTPPIPKPDITTETTTEETIYYKQDTPTPAERPPSADSTGSGEKSKKSGFHLPSIKLPLFGHSKQYNLEPEKEKEVKLQAPSAKMEFSAPEIEMPEIKVGAKMDTPDTKFGGKVGMPDIKLGGKMETPDLKLGGKVETPEMNIDGKMGTPDLKLGGKLETPEMHIDGKMGTPNLSFGGKMNVPDIKTDTNLHDINVGGNIKMPEVKASGKVGSPDLKLDGKMHAPDIILGGEMGTPDLKLGRKTESPELKLGEMETPEISLGGKMDKPEVHVDGKVDVPEIKTSGKFEMPKFKFGGKKSAPEAKVDVQIPEMPNISMDKDVQVQSALPGAGVEVSVNKPHVEVHVREEMEIFMHGSKETSPEPMTDKEKIEKEKGPEKPGFMSKLRDLKERVTHKLSTHDSPDSSEFEGDEEAHKERKKRKEKEARDRSADAKLREKLEKEEKQKEKAKDKERIKAEKAAKKAEAKKKLSASKDELSATSSSSSDESDQEVHGEKAKAKKKSKGSKSKDKDKKAGKDKKEKEKSGSAIEVKADKHDPHEIQFEIVSRPPKLVPAKPPVVPRKSKDSMKSDDVEKDGKPQDKKKDTSTGTSSSSSSSEDERDGKDKKPKKPKRSTKRKAPIPPNSADVSVVTISAEVAEPPMDLHRFSAPEIIEATVKPKLELHTDKGTVAMKSPGVGIEVESPKPKTPDSGRRSASVGDLTNLQKLKGDPLERTVSMDMTGQPESPGNHQASIMSPVEDLSRATDIKASVKTPHFKPSMDSLSSSSSSETLKASPSSTHPQFEETDIQKLMKETESMMNRIVHSMEHPMDSSSSIHASTGDTKAIKLSPAEVTISTSGSSVLDASEVHRVAEEAVQDIMAQVKWDGAMETPRMKATVNPRDSSVITVNAPAGVAMEVGVPAMTKNITVTDISSPAMDLHVADPSFTPSEITFSSSDMPSRSDAKLLRGDSKSRLMQTVADANDIKIGQVSPIKKESTSSTSSSSSQSSPEIRSDAKQAFAEGFKFNGTNPSPAPPTASGQTIEISSAELDGIMMSHSDFLSKQAAFFSAESPPKDSSFDHWVYVDQKHSESNSSPSEPSASSHDDEDDPNARYSRNGALSPASFKMETEYETSELKVTTTSPSTKDSPTQQTKVYSTTMTLPQRTITQISLSPEAGQNISVVDGSIVVSKMPTVESASDDKVKIDLTNLPKLEHK